MIQNKLYQKHFLLSTGILLACLVAGYLMTQLLVNNVQDKFGPSPAIFISRLIDSFPNEQRIEIMERIQKSAETILPKRYQLVDENGKVLFPEKGTLNFDWQAVKKPDIPHYKNPETLKAHGSRGGSDIVLLEGEPRQYLVMTFSGPPRSKSWVFTASLAILVSSLIIGMGLALLLIFRSMQQKVELADFVISELQRGNLKVRFPITKLDEIGKVMGRFNTMADEIERLVEQLRSVELTRIKLLQELAHDLRTPVASLKNLTETLHLKGDDLSTQIRSELTALCLKEIDYFEQLVEDLLVLAQVSEPRYHLNQVATPLVELIEEEAASAQKKQGDKKLNIIFDKNVSGQTLEVAGDPHLLRRLLRNSFENAFSFAKSEVKVLLRKDSLKEIEVVIEDDGPGFSNEVLKTFGERRVSRVLGTGQSLNQGATRLSVGLGSVIMKAIVDVHRGHLNVSNRTDGALGARVTVRLPIGIHS